MTSCNADSPQRKSSPQSLPNNRRCQPCDRSSCFTKTQPSSKVVDLPPDQRDGAVNQFREGILQEFHGQGMGRHTAEENYALARADMTALSDYLGERSYF